MNFMQQQQQHNQNNTTDNSNNNKITIGLDTHCTYDTALYFFSFISHHKQMNK